jgi:Ring finger domain
MSYETILQGLMDANREFYRNIRFLSADTRNAVVGAHERNVNMLLTFLRTQNQPLRYTLNIPLADLMSMDLSGNFLDPVPIHPTAAQIQAATENHVQVSDAICSICQESLTCATRIRRCGHCFHGHCISQWFTINPRCPMCRVDIRDTTVLEERRVDRHNDNSRDSHEE